MDYIVKSKPIFLKFMYRSFKLIYILCHKWVSSRIIVTSKCQNRL